jgi:hypothetical protein
MSEQTISYEYSAVARETLNSTRYVESKKVFFMQNKVVVSFFIFKFKYFFIKKISNFSNFKQ